MNQILVTEKLYVTPELKRKKKMYKIEFCISIFLVFLLSSYYIYAEYDRKSDNTVKKSSENDPIIIVLSESEAEQIDEQVDEQVTEQTNEIVSNIQIGDKTYSTEAIITIPKIDISYPVLSETSDELLEISVNRYWPEKDKMNPNDVGNYCIVGHNYRNGKMFGRLRELENGDIVELEDLTGRTIKYAVYDRFVVEPTDTKCTSQRTNGRKELTLITCTNYGTQRLVVKCREV